MRRLMGRRLRLTRIPERTLAVWFIVVMIASVARPGFGQQPAVVPADQTVVLEAADRARSRGSEDAPIRIVEISDFECPFCAQFYEESYRVVDSLYVQ
ncbi:MAG: thioredoxin domain-containing protein, partial [Gemmatimonadota bacterium]